MRVTIHILNSALETLGTSKSGCHGLGFYMEGCVTNANPYHKRNVLYPDNSMSPFTMILNFCITKDIPY